MFVPGSHLSHDRNFLASFEAFNILQTDVQPISVPHCLYTNLQNERTQEMELRQYNARSRLIEELFTTPRNLQLPTIDEIANASTDTPVSWTPLSYLT